MNNETIECENNIALAWFDDKYNQQQAKLTCEIQSLNFENVVNEYARLYEIEQCEGAEKWN